MCGRFFLTTPGEVLAELLGLADTPILAPRYNIAPTQPIAIARRLSRSSAPQLGTVRWGLIPSWSRAPRGKGPMINARAETVSEKPSFREAFEQRRCLVPADGFYEWKTESGRKTRQPHVVRLRDGSPFAFAGVWDRWLDDELAPVESCTILTTEPNELIRELHDRMPLILRREAYSVWLDPERDEGALRSLLRPFPADAMTFYPVGPAVNRADNDSPDCLEPGIVTPSTGQKSLFPSD